MHGDEPHASRRLRGARPLLVVLCLTLLAGPALAQRGDGEPRTCRVTRIIDGDTFECAQRGMRFSVRLLGMDTPELAQRPFGAQARRALARHLPVRQSVILDMDVRETDRYGRVLAYVWNDSALMVNEELLREGVALVDIQPPNVKYAEVLRAAAREAREGSAGFWATPGFDCPPAEFRRKRCR